jgi:hypothetical protein
MTVLEFAVGLVLVAAALVDVFVSILIPGTARGWPSVATLVHRGAVPAWRTTVRRRGTRSRARFANLFAPLLLSAVVASWLALLLLGFGLTFHASADLFTPPLDVFSQALYVAGSSILTLGVSEVDATGYARWLILAGALSGFSVITASVTFILQVQSALQEREKLVLTLAGLAGRPPSGLALLKHFAQVDMRDHLPAFFLEWRSWSTFVLHSHVAHPVLCYFHSVDQESDWLTALVTVLEASALIVALTDDPSRGPANLMHRSGTRTVAHLATLLRLTQAEIDEPEDAASITHELSASGYALTSRRDAAATLARLKSDYAGRAQGLAAHFGAHLPLEHQVPNVGSIHE